MKFLEAKWQHLLLANYAVQPALLEPFVPKGTVLDPFAVKYFVSLVAFLFDETRVLGIRVPYHVQFEEVNLRFYVIPAGDPTKRAVTFIKEIVPKRIIPLIANTLFNENYVALPMTHVNRADYHCYTWGQGNINSLSGRLTMEPTRPVPGSHEEFITEHYWGYAKSRTGTVEYRVEHPPWRVSELHEFEIAVDFAGTYGPEFGFLSTTKPDHVLYAEGSEVSVSFPKRL